jgi:hypothetical protein
MNERDMKVLEWVVRLGPTAMQEGARREGYRLAPARCIAATKIGIQTLDYFGITATPVPCNLIVGNAAWVRWLELGEGRGPMPDEAWNVAVHEQNTDGPGYNGHVMLRAGDMLVDLNFGQVSRPEKGMEVAPATAFTLTEDRLAAFDAGEKVVYYDDNDTVVIIEPTLGRKSFMKAKDWQRTQKVQTGLLIRMVKRMLAVEQPVE